MTWTTIHTVVRRGGEKNLTNRVCTAAEIGLGPGMLAFVQDAPAVGKSLVLDGCAQLDLSMSPIGIEGALALAHALTGGSARLGLTHVNLTWAGIGRGGAMLLKALADAPGLQSLDLSGNWLGDEFAPRVSRMMRKTPRLRVLRLRWNSFGDSSGRLIVQYCSTRAPLPRRAERHAARPRRVLSQGRSRHPPDHERGDGG